MNRCASSYGNGSIKTLSITLKIAVDAPIPNANVTMATSAKPRLFQSVRAAYRISCRSVSTSILPPLANAVANLDSASPAISVTVACGCQPQSEQNSTVHLSTGQLTGKFLHSATAVVARPDPYARTATLPQSTVPQTHRLWDNRRKVAKFSSQSAK